MPKTSPKNIAEAIYTASQNKSGADLEAVLKRAALFLKNKRLLNRGDTVLALLEDIIDKKTNTIRAKITTRERMDDRERKHIEESIRERYKAEKVVSEFFEDGEVLGGMRVEVGDEVLDTTYRKRLQKLEKFLIQGK
jgi:F0F1-type ATP synthase delta subunit